MNVGWWHLPKLSAYNELCEHCTQQWLPDISLRTANNLFKHSLSCLRIFMELTWPKTQLNATQSHQWQPPLSTRDNQWILHISHYSLGSLLEIPRRFSCTRILHQPPNDPRFSPSRLFDSLDPPQSPPNLSLPTKSIFPPPRDIHVSLQDLSSLHNFSWFKDNSLVIVYLMTNIYLWIKYDIFLLWCLVYLTQDNLFLLLSNDLQISWCHFFFSKWVIAHCKNEPHFLYPVFCWRTSTLFPISGCYE